MADGGDRLGDLDDLAQAMAVGIGLDHEHDLAAGDVFEKLQVVQQIRGMNVDMRFHIPALQAMFRFVHWHPRFDCRLLAILY